MKLLSLIEDSHVKTRKHETSQSTDLVMREFLAFAKVLQNIE